MRRAPRFSFWLTASAVVALAACGSTTSEPSSPADAALATDTTPRGDEPDGAGGTDGTDGGTPDAPGSCELMGCPAGASCVEGTCAFNGEAPCEATIERAVVPEFATSPHGLAATADFVAVAGAIGLELYAPTVSEDVVPTPIGFVALDGVGLDVAVDGTLAAVAHGEDGVTLVDVSDPTAPRPIATVPSLDQASGVALSGGRLAVADGAAGVALYDVADPTAPVLLGSIALDQPAAGVALDGLVVYVAAHAFGLVTIDFSATPTVTATHPIDGGDAVRVHLAAGHAWVAARYAGLLIFSLGSPTVPEPVAAYVKDGNMIVATDVAVDVAQRRAYVADFWRQVTVLDLGPVLDRSPAQDPSALSSGTESGYTHGIAVAAGRVWVAGDPLEVFDLNGESPKLLHRFGRRIEYVTAVPLELDDAGRVLVTDGHSELRVVTVGVGGYEVEARYTSAYPITSVTAAGSTAYVGVDTTQPMTATADLEVVALDAAGGPTRVGTLHLFGRLYDLTQADAGTLYAANGSALVIIDVTDPSSPVLVETVTTSWTGDSLALAGDRLAVFSRYRGVDFYDVTERRAPKHLGSFPLGTTGGSVTLDGSRAYVGHGAVVTVLELAAPPSPAAPAILSAAAELTLDGPVKDVAIDGQTLWILAGTRIVAAALSGPGTTGPGTLTPIAAIPSPGRAPVSLSARAGVVLASDTFEPLTQLSLGCTPSPVVYAAAGTPSAGVQWAHLATGADALTIADGPTVLLTIGYAQGSEPATFTDGAPTFAADGAAVTEPIVDLGDELVIATGEAAQPRVVRAARMGAPASDHVRLRAIDAALGAPVTIRVHRLAAAAGSHQATGATWPLGTLALGDHGPALDVAAGGQLEVWAAAGDRSLVATLPRLEAGHAHDLIVSKSAAGELLVLVQRDDGLTSVVAGPDYTTRLRVANLTGKALAVALEGETVREFERVASLASSAITTTRPGSKHLIARDAETGEPVFDQPIVPTRVGEQTTLVLYDGPTGLAAVRVTDFSGQQTGNGTTEVQLVNASGAALNATLLGVDGPELTGGKWPFGVGLPSGSVSPQLHPPVHSYALGLDLDQDGTSDKLWDIGYFPDYGVNVFVARDGAGRVRVGTQSPADVPIDWREARDDVATVRLMNLTGHEDLSFTVQPWYSGEAVTEPIGHDSGTYGYQLRAGAQTITLGQPATGKSWSWSGELAGDAAYTVVFWTSPSGAVASFVVQDRPNDSSGTAVRFVNTNAQGDVVTAWFAATEHGNGALLGTAAAGSATTPWDAGGDGAVTNGWLRVDRDGDGKADLRFALGTSATYHGVTNVFWVEDATWPYLVVQGPDYVTTRLYAEELQARLRIMVLPTAQSTTTIRLDGGEPFALYGNSSNGSEVKAHLSYWDPHSLVAGEHTLTVGEAGAEVSLTHDFPSESKTLLVLYGDPDHLSALWLDETDQSATGRTATVVNTNSVAAGVYTTTQSEGALWTPLVASLAPGAVSETLEVGEDAAHFGVDWGADGTVNWQAGQGVADGHQWVLLTASESGKPLLVMLAGSQYPWIWGELLP